MSVFVDTGAFYAHHDRDAARHETAKSAFTRLLSGTYGHLYTSDHVYGETVTLTRSRRGLFDDAKGAGDRILGRGEHPDVVELLTVSEDEFQSAVTTFERYDDHPLSFTDATTIALMEEHEIDSLLSFDDDFDGIVDRIDPVEIG